MRLPHVSRCSGSRLNEPECRRVCGVLEASSLHSSRVGLAGLPDFSEAKTQVTQEVQHHDEKRENKGSYSSF